MALLAAAAIVCLCTLPRTGADAAELLPAQVLVIAQEAGQVVVESDNGVTGAGAALPDALAAMHKSAPGTLFLDTAEHIILLESAWTLVPAVVQQPQLRPAAKLYLARLTALRASDCAAFLQAHPGTVTLAHAEAALLYAQQPALPVLEAGSDGGMQLAG